MLFCRQIVFKPHPVPAPRIGGCRLFGEPYGEVACAIIFQHHQPAPFCGKDATPFCLVRMVEMGNRNEGAVGQYGKQSGYHLHKETCTETDTGLNPQAADRPVFRQADSGFCNMGYIGYFWGLSADYRPVIVDTPRLRDTFNCRLIRTHSRYPYVRYFWQVECCPQPLTACPIRLGIGWLLRVAGL